MSATGARAIRSRTARGLLGPALVGAAFVGLTAWSFLKWTDVQVDFGVELYVPWQLTEGKALYRDIAYRNGPFSQYLNALWFTLFGVSLRTLVWCNLAILLGITAMIWRVFRRSCDATTATACCLVLLGMFGFSQYTVIANYNYVTPYQHYQTHGLALALAMILALSRGLESGRLRGWAGAGLALGCILLTKLELAVPAIGTAGGALALGRLWGRPSLRPLLALSGAALLPVLAFFLFLAAQMPSPVAWRGVLGNTAYLGQLASDPFYLRAIGVDAWESNASRMAAAFAALALAAVAVSLLDIRMPARLRSPAVATVGGVALFACLHVLPVPWVAVAAALPATALAAGSSVTLRCVRDRSIRLLPLALFSAYAFLLLGKIALHARFGQYGFVLAMPATLLLVATLVHVIPARLANRPDAGPGSGRVLRAAGLAATAACVLFFVQLTHRYHAVKTLEIGWGPDRILARGPEYGHRPTVIARGLERLREILPPEATLLVWPEGVGINYWLRHENPSRFNLFLPTEVAAFGPEAVLQDVQAHPPDYVVLLHREHEEFGAGRFGSTPVTGRDFLAWVKERYERVAQIGAEPFGRSMGMTILRRADARVDADPSLPGGF